MTEEIIKEEFDKAFKKHFSEAIIIDGVNVAECKDFLEPNGCDNTDTLSMTCSRNKNCYYKQIKRLEFENKLLKKNSVLIPIPPQETVSKREYERLEQELEKETDAKVMTKAKMYDYQRVLEEIRNLCNKGAGVYTNAKVVGLINEVLE